MFPHTASVVGGLRGVVTEQRCYWRLSDNVPTYGHGPTDRQCGDLLSHAVIND